ncbi:MAG: TlpA family protein disulfide reductase [Chitinophagales bacterium]|nr:TlpA family protein disulfide reductase [Chitinophagales bacterium]
MKFSNLILTALALFMVTVAFGQEKSKTLPNVEVKTLDGQKINIQDYATNGKMTIMSFWATWCSPCKKELDAIADIYPDWQEEYDVEMLAITIDTQRALAKVKPMVESKGWEYTVLSDVNQDLRQALNFQTIPQTFLLDKDGNIIYSHSGYVPGDEYELEDKIKEAAEK